VFLLQRLDIRVLTLLDTLILDPYTPSLALWAKLESVPTRNRISREFSKVLERFNA